MFKTNSYGKSVNAGSRNRGLAGSWPGLHTLEQKTVLEVCKLVKCGVVWCGVVVELPLLLTRCIAVLVPWTILYTCRPIHLKTVR